MNAKIIVRERERKNNNSGAKSNHNITTMYDDSATPTTTAAKPSMTIYEISLLHSANVCVWLSKREQMNSNNNTRSATNQKKK